MRDESHRAGSRLAQSSPPGTIGLVVPESCRELLNLQLVQCRDDPDAINRITHAEYRTFGRLISDARCVLDLGCGLGRMSCWIHRNSLTPRRYVLADTTRLDNPAYGKNPGDEWYNDLRLTAEFCDANGLDNYRIYDIRSLSLPNFQFDCILSFLSVGFHYPIESWLPSLLEVADSDCWFVFGVRTGWYDADSFAHLFRKRDLVDGFCSKEKVLTMRGQK